MDMAVSPSGMRLVVFLRDKRIYIHTPGGGTASEVDVWAKLDEAGLLPANYQQYTDRVSDVRCTFEGSDLVILAASKRGEDEAAIVWSALVTWKLPDQTWTIFPFQMSW